MNTHTNPALFEKVIASYYEKCAKGDAVLVGLSGGVDSMVLVESLRRAKVRVVALHFNHHWREGASDADERWVAEWCAGKNVELRIGHATTRGATSENEARAGRYNFFLKAASDLGIHQLWLAHHADDVVETFLMQLMRGAGPGGLTGIRDMHKCEGLEIIRPLTRFFKKDIEAQAKLWKLKWRRDSSNKDRKYLRNRVRLDAIPALSKAMRRDVRSSILRAALLLHDENGEWEKSYPAAWPEKLKVGDLRKMGIARQRRWIYQWLEAQNVPDIDFEDVESVRTLLTHVKPSKVNLSRGLHCRRREGILFIE